MRYKGSIFNNYHFRKQPPCSIYSDLAYICTMAVHIGNEIVRVLQERGMTKARFAERIGRHRVNIYGILRSADCSTAVLRKVCTALDYDFFRLLSEDTRTAGPVGSLSEPSGSYYAGPRSPMRIVIEVDPSDDEAKTRAVRLASELIQEQKSK